AISAPDAPPGVAGSGAAAAAATTGRPIGGWMLEPLGGGSVTSSGGWGHAPAPPPFPGPPAAPHLHHHQQQQEQQQEQHQRQRGGEETQEEEEEEEEEGEHERGPQVHRLHQLLRPKDDGVPPPPTPPSPQQESLVSGRDGWRMQSAVPESIFFGLAASSVTVLVLLLLLLAAAAPSLEGAVDPSNETLGQDVVAQVVYDTLKSVYGTGHGAPNLIAVVTIGTYGTGLVCCAGLSRKLWAMASDGFLPAWIGVIGAT
ncbi:hypothetical protein Agub_g12482, partial [Astrephomene gubernaculifera]